MLLWIILPLLMLLLKLLLSLIAYALVVVAVVVVKRRVFISGMGRAAKYREACRQKDISLRSPFGAEVDFGSLKLHGRAAICVHCCMPFLQTRV